MKRSSYFRALHFAYSAPIGESEAAGSCLWFRVRPDHHIEALSELNFTHRLESEVVADVITRDRMLNIAGRIGYTVANGECFTNASEQKGIRGQTVAETFAIVGLPLVQADPDTFNGWQRVRNLFRTAPDGTPWLIIDPSCEHLVRALGNSLSDESKPDELATFAPAAHALRYAAMSHPSPETLIEHETAPPGTPAAVMADLLGKTDGRRFGEAH